MTHDAGREMKDRMRADLRAALRQRQTNEARLLRALIAAIDNAEAPPLEAGRGVNQHEFLDGPAEIARRVLSTVQVRAALLSEVEERELAAAEMLRLGRPDRADSLRAEATLARRYLD